MVAGHGEPMPPPRTSRAYRTLLRRGLEGEGFIVSEAKDGAEMRLRLERETVFELGELVARVRAVLRAVSSLLSQRPPQDSAMLLRARSSTSISAA
jgi:DNA-binding response OmpR family regulator